MNIIDALSPHHNDRAAGKAVRHLVLHYTGMASVDDWRASALDIGVSAHYVIDEDGAIYRIVPEEKRAWHAGKSYWAGEDDINSVSIGIELQNPGHVLGLRPFAARQMDALLALGTDIVRRHGILPCDVLGHSDVAPARKADPGELFPWRMLARAGLGFWPEEIPEENIPDGAASLLRAIGYGPDTQDEKTLITAFQRHFMPEIFTQGAEHAGKDTAQARAVMAAVLRGKQAFL